MSFSGVTAHSVEIFTILSREARLGRITPFSENYGSISAHTSDRQNQRDERHLNVAGPYGVWMLKKFSESKWPINRAFHFLVRRR